MRRLGDLPAAEDELRYESMSGAAEEETMGTRMLCTRLMLPLLAPAASAKSWEEETRRLEDRAKEGFR